MKPAKWKQKEFPHGLTSVQTYKNGHILALDKNNILVLNRKGNIEEKYELDISPIKLFGPFFTKSYVCYRQGKSSAYICIGEI